MIKRLFISRLKVAIDCSLLVSQASIGSSKLLLLSLDNPETIATIKLVRKAAKMATQGITKSKLNGGYTITYQDS
jgi:hypothetical protein